jgi:hypothetical protein
MKNKYGENDQIIIPDKESYYLLLGYLTKGPNFIKIVYEPNQVSGAYGEEYRILFYRTLPTELEPLLKKTNGTGNIKYRVNCNDFIKEIIRDHNFEINDFQNIEEIEQTIPEAYLTSFRRGQSL